MLCYIFQFKNAKETFQPITFIYRQYAFIFEFLQYAFVKKMESCFTDTDFEQISLGHFVKGMFLDECSIFTV